MVNQAFRSMAVGIQGVEKRIEGKGRRGTKGKNLIKWPLSNKPKKKSDDHAQKKGV